MAGHLNLGVFSVYIYIYIPQLSKKNKKKLIIRLKINVLFIEIIKSKVYLRYIWDDKKITIKSIYKKNHRFSFPKF
jgi:hypothetical protein